MDNKQEYEDRPLRKILELNGRYHLRDTYTGESLMRHAEINKATLSELEKILIEKLPHLKLKDNDFGHWSIWQNGQDCYELAIAEGCSTSPKVEIKVKVEDYSDISKAGKQAEELHQAVVDGLISLRKICKLGNIHSPLSLIS